jgi:hypothetical protein
VSNNISSKRSLFISSTKTGGAIYSILNSRNAP